MATLEDVLARLEEILDAFTLRAGWFPPPVNDGFAPAGSAAILVKKPGDQPAGNPVSHSFLDGFLDGESIRYNGTSQQFERFTPSSGGLPAGAQGDVLVHNASTWVPLNVGTAGQVLKVTDIGGGTLEPRWGTDETGTGTVNPGQPLRLARYDGAGTNIDDVFGVTVDIDTSAETRFSVGDSRDMTWHTESTTSPRKPFNWTAAGMGFGSTNRYRIQAIEDATLGNYWDLQAIGTGLSIQNNGNALFLGDRQQRWPIAPPPGGGGYLFAADGSDGLQLTWQAVSGGGSGDVLAGTQTENALTKWVDGTSKTITATRIVDPGSGAISVNTGGNQVWDLTGTGQMVMHVYNADPVSNIIGQPSDFLIRADGTDPAFSGLYIHSGPTANNTNWRRIPRYSGAASPGAHVFQNNVGDFTSSGISEQTFPTAEINISSLVKATQNVQLRSGRSLELFDGNDNFAVQHKGPSILALNSYTVDWPGDAPPPGFWSEYQSSGSLGRWVRVTPINSFGSEAIDSRGTIQGIGRFTAGGPLGQEAYFGYIKSDTTQATNSQLLQIPATADFIAFASDEVEDPSIFFRVQRSGTIEPKLFDILVGSQGNNTTINIGDALDVNVGSMTTGLTLTDATPTAFWRASQQGGANDTFVEWQIGGGFANLTATGGMTINPSGDLFLKNVQFPPFTAAHQVWISDASGNPAVVTAQTLPSLLYFEPGSTVTWLTSTLDGYLRSQQAGGGNMSFVSSDDVRVDIGLPVGWGTSGQILTTNGTNAATWQDATGGGIGGSGTAGRIPRFSDSTTIGNSSISDTGAAATLNGYLNTNLQLINDDVILQFRAATVSGSLSTTALLAQVPMRSTQSLQVQTFLEPPALSNGCVYTGYVEASPNIGASPTAYLMFKVGGIAKYWIELYRDLG